jgi:hypothetical protein
VIAGLSAKGTTMLTDFALNFIHKHGIANIASWEDNTISEYWISSSLGADPFILWTREWRRPARK